LACWDSFVEETRNTHSFHSRVRAGPPSLLPHHAGRIDVVVIWARSPFAVSGVLHVLDGEKAEAPSTPRIILGAGFESSLRFSSTV
jgi:hypothetical protein